MNECKGCFGAANNDCVNCSAKEVENGTNNKQIKLDLDSYCYDGCSNFTAEINKIYISSGEYFTTKTVITCENRALCKRQADYLYNLIEKNFK